MSADLMQSLVQEAKKNRFSGIGTGLSDDDVFRIWENVASFVEKQMNNQKGVHISGFGTFSFVQKKLDVGGNKYVLLQRPVFTLAEKICQLHGLKQTRQPVTGSVPIVQLNFAMMAAESPFDRDQVETCVREMFGAMNRSVAAQRAVELVFPGVGRLQIRDSGVKFKFYKEFVNQLEPSGRVMQAMQNRPGTCDSVMTERPPTRPFSVSLPLPGISEKGRKAEDAMPTIAEDEADADVLDVDKERQDAWGDEIEMKTPPAPGKAPSSRMAVAVVTATNLDDLKPEGLGSAHGSAHSDRLSVHETNEFMHKSPVDDRAPLTPLEVAPPLPATCGDLAAGLSSKQVESGPISETQVALVSANNAGLPAGGLSDRTIASSYGARNQFPVAPPSGPASAPAGGSRTSVLTPPRPPSSACGHPSTAGQELCYLCHQRARRNIPVSFAAELRRRELEEDRLLAAYQFMRDKESIQRDQEALLAKRHDAQKNAAFNLGAGEAVRERKSYRDPNFYRSYLFQHRPLTPPRVLKQNEVSAELSQQVEAKDAVKKQMAADEAFLERLEQVQLAEDLAAQREQFLREKEEQRNMYRRALSAQVRHKPMPLPAREPDSDEPLFGRNDTNNEKVIERRRRAQDVFQEQMETVAQKKREAILRRLQEQRHEEEVVQRAREDLLNDRAQRYKRAFDNRRSLEDNWQKAALEKRTREYDEKIRLSTPGELVHEQVDKYKRCGQCKRKTNNVGETNIWCESFYIPGSRYIS